MGLFRLAHLHDIKSPLEGRVMLMVCVDHSTEFLGKVWLYTLQCPYEGFRYKRKKLIFVLDDFFMFSIQDN